MTIDGTPFSVSAANRTSVANFGPGELGDVDAADDADRNRERARRARSAISVPTMALAMPPPGSPTGFGICVKKSQFSAWTPC